MTVGQIRKSIHHLNTDNFLKLKIHEKFSCNFVYTINCSLIIIFINAMVKNFGEKKVHLGLYSKLLQTLKLLKLDIIRFCWVLLQVILRIKMKVFKSLNMFYAQILIYASVIPHRATVTRLIKEHTIFKTKGTLEALSML